jgi:Lrp/AsnC family leucine-responsive transcriptional regulator
MDGIDRKILSILLRDATIARSDVAKAVGIAPSAISERIKKLEKQGVITRYETRLNPARIGYSTLAFVFITERKPNKGADTGGALATVTGVEEVHKIAGDDCYLVKIRTRSTEELARILDAQISAIPTVLGTRTTIVLRTIREDASLGGVDLEDD